MTTIDNIKSQLECLPEKDRSIALNLIEKRDFETLKELVVSDVIKAKRELEKLNIEEEDTEPLAIAYACLQNLEFCVSEYASQFDTDTDIDDIDYSEEEENQYFDTLFYMYTAK